MRRPPSRPWTSSELRIGGSPSSNWTSTTAPITATTRPATPAFVGAGAGAAGFGLEPFEKKRWFAVRRENRCEFGGPASMLGQWERFAWVFVDAEALWSGVK